MLTTCRLKRKALMVSQLDGPGVFGCLAVDSIYNVFYQADVIACVRLLSSELATWAHPFRTQLPREPRR